MRAPVQNPCSQASFTLAERLCGGVCAQSVPDDSLFPPHQPKKHPAIAERFYRGARI